MSACLDSYQEMKKPTDIRDCCSAVVWNERQKSAIESQVGPVFQTVAWGLSQLAPRPGSNPERRASPPSSLREDVITCWLDSYPLYRNRPIEAVRFVSILAQADSFLRNNLVRSGRGYYSERASAVSTRRLLSAWISRISKARTMLAIQNGSCTSLNGSVTLERRSTPGRLLFHSLALMNKFISSERGHIGRTVSLWSNGFAHGTDMGWCTNATGTSPSLIRHNFVLTVPACAELSAPEQRGLSRAMRFDPDRLCLFLPSSSLEL